MSHFLKVMLTELQLNPRLELVTLLARLLPSDTMGRTRTRILRLSGVPIGEGTVFSDVPRITGPHRTVGSHLRIGRLCYFNVDCMFDVQGTITVGDRVSVGQRVSFITSSHELGDGKRRAADVIRGKIHVGDGAWIGTGAIVLPDVSIGAGAIVGAGAVVTRDVPPNVMVAGVPAEVVRKLGAA